MVTANHHRLEHFQKPNCIAQHTRLCGPKYVVHDPKNAKKKLYQARTHGRKNMDLNSKGTLV
jgi:hypothetical protein